MMPDTEETHLGDGVSARLTDDMIELRFRRIVGCDDVVYIGPDAFAALVEFARKVGFKRQPDVLEQRDVGTMWYIRSSWFVASRVSPQANTDRSHRVDHRWQRQAEED